MFITFENKYVIKDFEATEVDAKADQLHIGNRWIGHKSLDLYDNTARMHDPLLARLPQFFVLIIKMLMVGYLLMTLLHVNFLVE